MNPIIPPSWIYLIHVANTIYDLSIFVLMVSIVILLLLGIGFAMDPPDSEKIKKYVIKALKICAVTIIVSVLVLVLVPDKKTMYAMIAASMITPDNISGVEEHVIDIITNIANAVNNAK